jgi:hypothetical protein
MNELRLRESTVGVSEDRISSLSDRMSDSECEKLIIPREDYFVHIMYVIYRKLC